MFTKFSRALRNTIVLAIFLFLFVAGFKFFNEFLIFKKIIHNLKAESRIAEVLVVESSLDEFTRKYTTTIKFLEYDVHGKPLKPKYFTFKGNLIQFQTLVVRFDDRYIEQGHRMKGKSVYLFLKAFVLDGKDTEEFIITPTEKVTAGPDVEKMPFWVKIRYRLTPSAFKPSAAPAHVVPDGYRVGDPPNYFEKEIWSKFWQVALDPDQRKKIGIKNAQVEAPGAV